MFDERRCGDSSLLPPLNQFTEPLVPLVIGLSTADGAHIVKILAYLPAGYDEDAAEEILDHFDIEIAAEHKDAEAFERAEHHQETADPLAEPLLYLLLAEAVWEFEDNVDGVKKFGRLKRMQHLQCGFARALLVRLAELKEREDSAPHDECRGDDVEDGRKTHLRLPRSRRSPRTLAQLLHLVYWH